ncbi:MAG TPA: hypothetical protein VEU62_19850 [Bryobacterales bacterium]|nr:hypothetical protein [Bryobacterales bacterium]
MRWRQAAHGAALAVLAILLAGGPAARAAAAAQHREELTYSFDIDPGEWRYFEFPVKEKDARLEVRFEARGRRPSPGVRVAVMAEGEFRRFRDNQPHQEIGATRYRAEGMLQARLAEPGQYVVVIDNGEKSQRRRHVEMESVLVTGPAPETLPVQYLSPEKRAVVTGASAAGFLLILALAGRALWRATRRRPLQPYY